MVKTIGNPLSWTAKIFGLSAQEAGEVTREFAGKDTGPIDIRKLDISDLRIALRNGTDDFLAFRTDVIFLIAVYPVIGFLLVRFFSNSELLPLVFPLISGFALVGPIAAIGLYELSRQREKGLEVGWGDAFAFLRSPSLAPIVVLGGGLLAIFLVWMYAASLIYHLTLGPEPPTSAAAFARSIFTTGAGWVMLIGGVAVGFLFAAAVMAISVVSFPLLLDRHVGLPRAVVASVNVTRQNPIAVGTWGLIVVLLLGVGVMTLFLALIVVLPILGHATWHLYRRAIASAKEEGKEPTELPPESQTLK